MVSSVGVSNLGKTTLHFVNPSAKVNGEYYRNELLEMMLHEMRILAGGRYFIFQQDEARTHTANDAVAYLKDNVPEFIEPENWPPKSPDLHPVDYSIWENLSQRVCNYQRIRDVQHLKNLLEKKWEELPPYEIDACINQFRHRLRKVIEVAGKHMLNHFSRIAVLGEMLCDC